jgi:class 3 adenylate cyclase/tetratricopeptide (TPR) repeat protein
MHNLIPHFIFEQYQLGKQYGRFEAATLFLDISGFTAMTQTLMAHGKEGAEVMAALINQIFDPIIHAIYAREGFVAGFAGDALTAIFPATGQCMDAACTTALAICEVFAEQKSETTTQLGNFRLIMKQGLSVGMVEWGIVGPPSHPAFFFCGEAIDGCAHAEQQAGGNDIVVDGRLLAQLPATVIQWQPLDAGYARLIGWSVSAVPTRVAPPALPTILWETAVRFFPENIWRHTRSGEFRDVATLFVSFAAPPTIEMLNAFITEAITLADHFGGFFTEIDFGDKGSLFIVYFGAPVTHEHDVKRALHYLEALTAVRTPLSWRAGLTYGTVYAGYVGIPLRDKYTCLGSVVNLAARLMAQAKWGQVLVSERVALASGFNFVRLGELSYKGFSRLIPTYQWQGKTAVERVFQHQLVGREAELQQLIQFVQSLLHSNSGGVAIIYGDAGIGKSHLSHALHDALKGSACWLTGQADNLMRDAFNPFAYFLKGYFNQSAENSTAQNKAAFERQVDAVLTFLAQTPNNQHRYEELYRTRSLLGALLGLYWPDSLYDQLDARTRYQNTLIAVATLIQAECQRQPLVLELEDSHWFDEASLELLTLLARQAVDLPLLILLTSRFQDDGTPPTYPIANNTSLLTITLKTLPAAAVQALAHEIVGLPVDGRLYQLLLEKTEGNPFFVQQILYYLRENGLLQEQAANSEYVVTLTSSSFDLPTTLNALLIARMDRLPADVKEVVQTAAVLGREFDSRLLKPMLDQDVEAALVFAEQEQIWLLLEQWQYIFRHALLRDAAYEMQLRTRLRQLHYLAAVKGEQIYGLYLSVYYGYLAYHYEVACRLGEEQARPQAINYLFRAGQQALNNFEHLAAIDYFNRGLDLVADTDRVKQYQFLWGREKAYDFRGDRPVQLADLEYLTELAQHLDGLEAVEVALRRSYYAELVSDYAGAISWAETAVKLADEKKDERLLGQAYSLWGAALHRLGQYERAAAQYTVGLEIAHQINYVTTMAFCLRGLGNVANRQGRHDEAITCYQQSLVLARELGDLQGEGASLNNLGIIASNRQDYVGAAGYYEQSLVIWRKMGQRRAEAVTLSNLGLAAYNQGDYEKAAGYHRASLSIKAEVDDRRGQSITLINLGNVLAHQGAYDQAIGCYEQALAISVETGGQWEVGINLNELGAVYLAQHDLDRAYDYYQRALLIRQEMNLPHYVVEDWAGLGRVALAQGNVEIARQYGRQILDYLQTDPTLNHAENPLRVFRFAWEVWIGLGEREKALAVLRPSAKILQAYLAQNSAPSLQQMYLNQPHHHVLWAAWQHSR